MSRTTSVSIPKIVLVSSMVVTLCFLALYFFQVAQLIEGSYLLSASQSELAGLAKQNLAFNQQAGGVSAFSMAEQSIAESGFVKVSAVTFIPIMNDYLVVKGD